MLCLLSVHKCSWVQHQPSQKCVLPVCFLFLVLACAYCFFIEEEVIFLMLVFFFLCVLFYLLDYLAYILVRLACPLAELHRSMMLMLLS